MTSVSCRVWPSWQHKCDPYGPRGTLSWTCLLYAMRHSCPASFNPPVPVIHKLFFDAINLCNWHSIVTQSMEPNPLVLHESYRQTHYQYTFVFPRFHFATNSDAGLCGCTHRWSR